ncbi:NACHT domain-containing protein [Blastococcus sp. URHD0036]|uniref:NACHT domain-containing protein n=1 Tax=Blastococcus sp. URHD0036 TaxID=1380356 RepID=UPI000495A91E|nr:NACHT domain-containing protein [Blastococcus sp. URHD0036]
MSNKGHDPCPSSTAGAATESASRAADSAAPNALHENATQAWLWTPPDEQPTQPPVVTKATALPLLDLSWQNVERLFVQLLAGQASVVRTKLYGTAGQEQEGIDVYARMLPPSRSTDYEATDTLTARRLYAVLQSRRVQKLSSSDITGAVDDFLAGSWPASTRTFYYATTFDLTDTRLDDALRAAEQRLAAEGITFIPWGAEDIFTMLRRRPQLVDDFFGRHWVETFCGPEAVTQLRTRLTFDQASQLRADLDRLYRATFDAQNAVRPPQHAAVDADRFIVLDITPGEDSLLGSTLGAPGSVGDQSGGPLLPGARFGFGPSGAAETDPRRVGTGAAADAPSTSTPAAGLDRPRRTLRPAALLLTESSSGGDGAYREQADIWLSRAPRSLVVGGPGSGKSSLLRFVARDLLSSDPHSTRLQQEHGGRLPIWLPFGFLTRHLDDADTNSLQSAIRSWLSSQDAAALWPLVEQALDDDRLVLLIDGIDEWKSLDAANHALGAIETFLNRTRAAAVLSSRPYAVTRLASASPWRRGDLAPLTDKQRRHMAAQYLADDRHPQAPQQAEAAEPPSPQRQTSGEHPRPGVDSFIAELSTVPELSDLTRTPLFLALLAERWRGEPLPRKRYELYTHIVELLVVRHPHMRRRASRAGQRPLADADFKLVFQAVAYSLRADGHTGPLPTRQMTKRIQAALADDDILGYPPAESHRMAAAALTMAEDEFGLVVSQGADHVGFLHRVVLDHLAGQHLARQDPAEQLAVFTRRYTDPAWQDVLLSALAGSRDPDHVAALLDGPLARTDDRDSQLRWPDDVRQRHASQELIANALAADVVLPADRTAALLDLLIDEVDTSPWLEHRAALVTALVGACAEPSRRTRLFPTFKRWLGATRPFPGPAVWSLARLPLPDDRVLPVMLWALRSTAPDVRASAAEAIARRFGPAPPPPRQPTATSSDDDRTAPSDAVRRLALTALLHVIRDGPTVSAQAAALLALGLGWPHAPETYEHLAWGRRQRRFAIRTTALYLAVSGTPDAPARSILTPEETRWLLDHLQQEYWWPEQTATSLLHEAVARVVQDAEPPTRAAITDDVLNTLRTNGRRGGNRPLALALACGPLADDDRVRDWFVSELGREHGGLLQLSNLSALPQQWRDHVPLQDALGQRLEAEAAGLALTDWLSAAAVLPPDRRRAVLLQGLNAWRPWGIAAQLNDQFGHDEAVRAELIARLTDDSKAAALSPIALDVLGLRAGFERILGLLLSSHQADSPIRGQDQVVLAQSVASAWHLISEAASTSPTATHSAQVDVGLSADERRSHAREILAAYRPTDVCASCTRVPTSGLGWHIADIIYTWPDLTVDYALDALRSNRHVTDGIPDTIHSAALRAHIERPCARSPQVVDEAMNLMGFLDAELREVLAHELCRSSLTPTELGDVLAAWKTDPDNGVRRTVTVGMTLHLLRHQAANFGTSAELLPELARWQQEVRDDLCCYGPTFEEDRQNAWISMLLLERLDLIDGLREAIGEPTEPGVRLHDIFGNPDEMLVRLIADSWARLTQHFGSTLLTRLTGGRIDREPVQPRLLRALESLALAADQSPDIQELLSAHLNGTAESDAGSAAGPHLLADAQTRQQLSLAPTVIDWRQQDASPVTATVQWVLRATEDGSASDGDRHQRVNRWALQRLLDEQGRRPASMNDIRRALIPDQDSDAWIDASAWSHAHRSVRRTAFTLLFPEDAQTRYWRATLSDWFRERPPEMPPPANWVEVAALCFGAGPAAELPALVGGLFHPRRTEHLRDSLWQLTLPLLYRLRRDPAARRAMLATIAGSQPTRPSPWFFDPDDLPAAAGRLSQLTAGERDSVGRNVLVASFALQAIGQLPAESLTDAIESLRRVDPRAVASNPFIEQTGPLWTLGMGLGGS